MSRHANLIFEAIETGDATSALLGSWRRCATLYQLTPDTLIPPESDSAALREGLERDATLVAAARPYLDRLFGGIAWPDVTVWLTDRHGMVVDQRTSRTQDTWRRKPSRLLGARYDERTCGTSGVGTCLAEGRPLVVAGAGHFFAHYVPITGIGAPIFGPDAETIGCLSCSYHTGAGDCDALILSILSGFSRRIGIELFAAAFPNARLLLASRDGTMPCALLAVDSDDRVVGASRSARRRLDLDDARIAAGVSSRDLFDLPDELASAEARLIAQAMAHHRNNRSAVAKALGISRSTLYRKLAARPPVAGLGKGPL